MEIRGLLMELRAGVSQRQIAREQKVNRRTVKKYKEWAERKGLLKGELPPLEELQEMLEEAMPEVSPPQNKSTVEEYREQVVKWGEEGVEVAAMWERLKEKGYKGSYMAVYRYTRRLRGKGKLATVRVEREPGEEAQVDFGYAGKMMDEEKGELRRAWAFVMTLSWSRHQYVEFVFNQKVETWLKCHRHAFEYFGGVPERVVVDNLKAAIVKATRDDPGVQASYQECALHYGFRIGPCRVRTPQHKGKVEQGGVHYVKRNFLGGREVSSLRQANREVLVWCETTAGLRKHGTHKEQPLKRFRETEQGKLRPLPASPYDMAVWKELKLGRDCYVEFEQSYYSAPHRLVGQKVWVCGGLKQVRIFDCRHKLIATHERAGKAGTRRTEAAHLPPEKVPGLQLSRAGCRQRAEEVGAATQEVVEAYLSDKAVEHLPTVGRLLRLGERYGDERLEAACRRGLAHGDAKYVTIRGILKKGLEEEEAPKAPVSPPASAFVRPPSEIFGAELGAVQWN